MTTQGTTIIYGIEDLRRVFELLARVAADKTGLGDLTEAEIQTQWEQFLTSQGLAANVSPEELALQQVLGGGAAVKPVSSLSDLEIEGLLSPMLERAQAIFIEGRTAAQQGDPQRAIRAWQEFYRQHIGTQGLGKVSTTAEAQQRQARTQAIHRQELVNQGLGFLQANLPPTASLEYRDYLADLVGQGVDAYLAQEQTSGQLGTAAPDFAQFMAPLVVRVPSEKAYRSTQATATKESTKAAGLRLGIQQGLISSKSTPEEIDAFQQTLDRAQQVAALQQQEAENNGQPFDYLDALGLALQQASGEQKQAAELEGFVRTAGISSAKRKAEAAQAAQPLADVGTNLPQTLQDYLRTPYQGDERDQLTEQFFREFVNQQPSESLSAFMRPQPGFAQLSAGDQGLLERVAKGEFPQWEQPGGPFAATGGPLGAGAEVLPGPLGPAGFVPTQTSSQRAANELFGFLNQGQQKGFDPFDLQGFLKATRQKFTTERLPKIDLESFLPKSTRPQRVGRTIFASGGF